MKLIIWILWELIYWELTSCKVDLVRIDFVGVDLVKVDLVWGNLQKVSRGQSSRIDSSPKMVGLLDIQMLTMLMTQMIGTPQQEIYFFSAVDQSVG